MSMRVPAKRIGAVLYQMPTGNVPFQGCSLGVICGAILHQEPIAALPQFSEGFEATIPSCWRHLDRPGPCCACIAGRG